MSDFKSSPSDLAGDLKVSKDVTIGSAIAVDTYLTFDGNEYDFRMGIDDSSNELEIGLGTAHDTTAGLVISNKGMLTLPMNFTMNVGFATADPVPGPGITTGTGTLCKSSVVRAGNLAHTSILIDITGLASTADGEIIGKVDAGDACIANVSSFVCGTIYAGRMTCLEVPTIGEPDIDLYKASAYTGDAGSEIGDLAESVVLSLGAADWTLGLTKNLATAGLPSGSGAPPAAVAMYLYLVASEGDASTTAETYGAGVFLIEFWGHF